jgi:uncharacterized protein
MHGRPLSGRDDRVKTVGEREFCEVDRDRRPGFRPKRSIMNTPFAAPGESDEQCGKLTVLRAELERLGPVLVSYSGGVDSALLAVIARDVLGDGMACAFLDSPLVPRAAAAEARALAEEYGLPLVVIPFDPLGIPAVAANPRDRCYHCKRGIAGLLNREAGALGLKTVVDGVSCSDISEYRPGLAACAEEGIVHPYVSAGITKPEIREFARSLGLSFAEKPSAACLASRVPYGDALSPAQLARIEEAEEALQGLGFSQGRVRAHGRLARVEVPAAVLQRALDAAPLLVAALKAAGFVYVTLDLEGYRSGAMDEVPE